MANCLLLDLSLKGLALGCADLDNFSGLSHKVLLPGTQGSNGDINRFVEDFPEYSHIAVSCGPGSFTGIKVGLAWVYGYQSVNPDLQVAGFSSLREATYEIMRSHGEKSPTALFWPSTRTHGFLCVVRSPDELDNELRLINASVEMVDPLIAELLQNGVRIYKALDWPFLEEGYLKGCKVHPLHIEEALEFALLGMGRKAAAARNTVFSTDNPQPLYLRASTAEEKLTPPEVPS